VLKSILLFFSENYMMSAFDKFRALDQKISKNLTDTDICSTECSSRGQCYKTFYAHHLQMFCNKLECLSLADKSNVCGYG
jgi:hypothetical protein